MKMKYPRTYHLPWSEGRTDDDKTHTGEVVERMFSGNQVVVTEKMDGENTTLHADGRCHARSPESASHPSRTWVRALAARIAPDLPKGWRVCGENMYARHSLAYDRLPSYFLVFAIFDGDKCLSWEETLEWCGLLGLTPVPVLFEGAWSKEEITLLNTGGPSAYGPEREGYVVRVAESFRYGDFAHSVAKFVRVDHVQTDSHWMKGEIVPNGLGEPIRE